MLPHRQPDGSYIADGHIFPLGTKFLIMCSILIGDKVPTRRFVILPDGRKVEVFKLWSESLSETVE